MDGGQVPLLGGWCLGTVTTHSGCRVTPGPTAVHTRASVQPLGTQWHRLQAISAAASRGCAETDAGGEAQGLGHRAASWVLPTPDSTWL